MASTINVSDYVLLGADGDEIANDNVILKSRCLSFADYNVISQ